MELKSEAFENGGSIPKRHTCEGEDVSPPLSWSGVPPGARSLVLTCEDPDAPLGTFVHWILYDISTGQTALNADRPKEPVLLEGSRHGKNGFGRVGWSGPCPPAGPSHRYFFTLYALDRPLGLEPGASKAEVEKAMKGRVLARAELMGLYRKVRLSRFVQTLLGR